MIVAIQSLEFFSRDLPVDEQVIYDSARTLSGHRTAKLYERLGEILFRQHEFRKARVAPQHGGA